MNRTLVLLLTALAAFLVAPAAQAASKLTIRGAGWGHGIGMSQWGAYGMAREGFAYDRILGHYYTGTRLGVIDPNRPVRVLLDSGWRVTFAGASRIGGRNLDPANTYAVTAVSGELRLRSPSNRVLARFSGPVSATGPGALYTGGKGYRGGFELQPTGGSVNLVNVVNLEQYVRGVVALESPATWPLEALKAQAVAARTYAITTSKSGVGFDHYPDTRSQVYGGISAERPTTDRAVAATSGHVVTYDGRPVTTYFFSTSGGRTEDVENVWAGASPSPWLRSVKDPYDRYSPRHRWKPATMSLSAAQRKLGNLVKGRLRGIKVLRRGSSPRIVEADVVGTRGRTRVSGATLRLKLGLQDTWAYFTTLTARSAKPKASGTSQGGVSARRRGAVAELAGSVVPAARGDRVRVQRRVGGRWLSVGRVRVSTRGTYRTSLDAPGLYRVRQGGAVGPRVRVR